MSEGERQAGGHAQSTHARVGHETVEHPTVVAFSRALRSPTPLASHEWEDLLAELVGAIAVAADADGARLIGHVKALAILEDGYVRASAVDVAHSPTTECRGAAVCAAADLTVNVLIYGLSATAVSEIAEAVVSRVASNARVGVTAQPPLPSGHEHGTVTEQRREQ